MAYDRFLIAPFSSGFQTDLKPWLLPEDAFTRLQNAYVFRGRVRKRFGGKWMGVTQFLSRFRINVVAAVGTVPGSIFKVGQAFTVTYEVSPGVFVEVMLTVAGTGFAVMLSTNPGVSGTYNTANGAYTIVGAVVLTPIYFYPAEPVMGLTQYLLNNINNQPSYGFDTQFAYTYSGASGWQLSQTGGIPTFRDPSGAKLNYVYSCNWEGITQNTDNLFITNFQVSNPNGIQVATDDNLFRFDGSSWFDFFPYIRPGGLAVATGPYVLSCRIIIEFKERLILLNTIENDNVITVGAPLGTNSWYPNRARYCANASPLARNAWYEPNQFDGSPPVVAGDNKSIGGSFIDATTDEQIVSVGFIKDRLIVYFERSTWEIVYLGNDATPFRWQKINTELGSESPFSSVPFDKVLLAIGQTGVHACSGANVERIDEKIPDKIFEIATRSSEPVRVQGIRDFYTEMVYWCYPPQEQSQNTFPAQVLVYNYRNGSWSINDDCITAFGYFQQPFDISWALSPYSWNATSNTWVSGVSQALFRDIIAGNSQGYVFVVQPDMNENASVMQVSRITTLTGQGVLTIVDHTLIKGEYIYLEGLVGTGTVPLLNGNIFAVSGVLDKDRITITPNTPITGAYNGGGLVKRVSSVEIDSKQWNPYVDKGYNVYLAKIDFCVQRTGGVDTLGGEITVDYAPSSVERFGWIDEGIGTGSILGTGILETYADPNGIYPLEQFQDRLWHPVYFQTSGECIQIFMYFSDEQIRNIRIAFAPFQLEGIILQTQPTSSRLE